MPRKRKSKDLNPNIIVNPNVSSTVISTDLTKSFSANNFPSPLTDNSDINVTQICSVDQSSKLSNAIPRLAPKPIKPTLVSTENSELAKASSHDIKPAYDLNEVFTELQRQTSQVTVTVYQSKRKKHDQAGGFSDIVGESIRSLHQAIMSQYKCDRPIAHLILCIWLQSGCYRLDKRSEYAFTINNPTQVENPRKIYVDDLKILFKQSCSSNVTPRNMALKLCDHIFVVSKEKKILGNAYVSTLNTLAPNGCLATLYIKLNNNPIVADLPYWASDFHRTNPSCPAPIREWLQNRYDLKYSKKTVSKSTKNPKNTKKSQHSVDDSSNYSSDKQV